MTILSVSCMGRARSKGEMREERFWFSGAVKGRPGRREGGRRGGNVERCSVGRRRELRQTDSRRVTASRQRLGMIRGVLPGVITSLSQIRKVC